MEQHSSENSGTQVEARAVDASLKALWEKARRAAETIAKLREDNQELRSRIDDLNRQLQQVQHDLARKDQIISQQNADLAGATAKRPAMFDNGERELLATRVKDLLAKIESYL